MEFELDRAVVLEVWREVSISFGLSDIEILKQNRAISEHSS